MRINTLAASAVLVAVFAAGAATALIWPRRSPSSAIPPVPAVTGQGTITLSPEAIERAGIVVERASGLNAALELRVPGTVQPNAYHKVAVTPLVGGRVQRVPVELGQAVSRGALLAEIYSPEVAQARANYANATADLAAGEAKLRRTERLANLGSASRQELDDVHAEHVRHDTELREAAARLRLFGLDPAHVGIADPVADAAASVIRLRAPQSGVVIERPATVGMTVEPATTLVTLAELSPVWVIADVFERDFARVKEGTDAIVTTDAYPGLALRGKVVYLSPDVRAETRTTQVRIEVPNTERKLRFGMYVNVTLSTNSGAEVLTIPRSAVQTIGSDQVVFVPSDSAPGTFSERRVTVGDGNEDRVAVTAGLAPGDRLVTQGSFTLRAEAERLGIRPPQQAFTVQITSKGFEPATLALSAGVPVKITFIRRTDATCATEIALPEYAIKRDLPLNTPVTVEFTPRKDAVMQCGTGMLSGALIVR